MVARLKRCHVAVNGRLGGVAWIAGSVGKLGKAIESHSQQAAQRVARRSEDLITWSGGNDVAIVGC